MLENPPVACWDAAMRLLLWWCKGERRWMEQRKWRREYGQGVPGNITEFSTLGTEDEEEAQGVWIVICDADERVTPRLAADLQAATAGQTDYVAFADPGVKFFWGERITVGWRESHVRI